MAVKKCSDEEFLETFKTYGPSRTCELTGMSLRRVYRRRNELSDKLNKIIDSPFTSSGVPRIYSENVYEKRVPYSLKNGCVLVGSDAHYWPDLITTAHRGFCFLAKKLKPAVVIMNGDVFDGAKISRHPPIGWQKKPGVKEELQAVDDRLAEIEDASPQAKLFWTIGNHDARFENFLANKASEMDGIAGMSLKDHFPEWKLCMSLWLNDTVIKHRFKGGVHASHNNTLHSGKSIVTGHLHSLKVCPYDDYLGTRYGVDTGTLAEPEGPQFEYGEDNPRNHRSGFIVLTYNNHKLLLPEIAAVVGENHIQFRGELIKV